jgi:ethanolamine utilization protein EutP (predicted NTPase)
MKRQVNAKIYKLPTKLSTEIVDKRNVKIIARFDMAGVRDIGHYPSPATL